MPSPKGRAKIRRTYGADGRPMWASAPTDKGEPMAVRNAIDHAEGY